MEYGRRIPDFGSPSHPTNIPKESASSPPIANSSPFLPSLSPFISSKFYSLSESKMHRSGSTTRASDFFLSATPGKVSLTPDMDQLPTYSPQSELSRKEVSRVRSAECAIHIIPVVLFLCAILLWLFSYSQIDLTTKGDSSAARVNSMTVDAYTNITGS